MNSNLKVYIHYGLYSHGLHIMIVDETNPDKPLYAEPVNLSFKEAPQSCFEDARPTFTFANRLGEQFVKAMVEAADKQGIKPEGQSVIEGKYEAQSKHLEDMRTLVFKRKIGAK